MGNENSTMESMDPSTFYDIQRPMNSRTSNLPVARNSIFERLANVINKLHPKIEGFNLKQEFASDVLTDRVLAKYCEDNNVLSAYEALKAGNLSVNPQMADAIAEVMKQWALSKGATHFTHWFQPMTGLTAEKHDSFLKISSNGLTMEFSGKELIKGETDGSSFPSGGLRSTFEARGYTVWDTNSPVFIREAPTSGSLEGPQGKVLIIPTAFLSWTGESLDTKTPLLRSEEVLSRQATRLLHLLGEKNVKYVYSTLGPEQEFFLIDKAFLQTRPDLLATGRTLVGAKPSKGQELEDHYFGKIPSRILACLQETEQRLWKLGVPVKTRHNEVSPAQYEMAPIFERSVLASDHNMIMMDVLREVADRHGLACLFHEKPFASVNGSGKHNNWSLATNTGENLLEPTGDIRKNIRFLVFLAAIIRGVHLHADLLRASIAVPGNDHRLGANEAPPAIISIYLGEHLDRVCQQLMGRGPIDRSTDERAVLIELGVSSLPHIPRDTSDRNRTSPFAFTGNKFEFRAVGSSQSCGVPIYHLNTIVAESVGWFADEIEKGLNTSKDSSTVIENLIRNVLEQHYAIVFNGNNYSQEWVDEAKRRGLPILRTTPEALAVYNEPKNRQLFAKMGVLSEVELAARTHVSYEHFLKSLRIEGNTLLTMLNTQILPAGLAYQGTLAKTIKDTQQALGYEYKNKLQTSRLYELTTVIDSLIEEIEELRRILQHNSQSHLTGSERELLEEFHPKITEAMASARRVADELETLVPDNLWPLPKYSEMLLLI